VMLALEEELELHGFVGHQFRGEAPWSPHMAEQSESLCCMEAKFVQPILDPAPRPAHEAVIDRRRRTIGRRAIAPATAAFQHLHDAADDAAVVHPLDPADIGKNGSIRFHCSSLSQNKFLLTISNPSRQRITILLSAKKD
jgi:hypothetical protein